MKARHLPDGALRVAGDRLWIGERRQNRAPAWGSGASCYCKGYI
ncbi:hypothetical protein [Lysobacter gummosus]